jgi:hypothetical protein
MLLFGVPCTVLPGSSAPSYDLDITTLRTTAATTATNAAHANSVWVASCNLLNVCGTCAWRRCLVYEWGPVARLR